MLSNGMKINIIKNKHSSKNKPNINNNAISNPVNKSLDNLIEKNIKKKKEKKRKIMQRIKELENCGISVITSTNRPQYIENIFNNYSQQDFFKKELIIILNTKKIDLDIWYEKAKDMDDIKIFQLDENISLGNCLNFAVEKSTYDMIAKFDDDDYYGPKYLSNSINAFKHTTADVVGKASLLTYFEKDNLLAIRDPNKENQYVRFVNGSTLIFRKKIFNKVNFRNLSIAEDVYFCKDCINNRIKIYSTNIYDHVYIRHKTTIKHTWKISDSNLRKKYCKVIGETQDYVSYALK